MTARILVTPHSYANPSVMSYSNVYPYNIMFQHPYAGPNSAFDNDCNTYAGLYQNISGRYNSNYHWYPERNCPYSRKRKRPFTIAALLGLNNNERDHNDCDTNQNARSQQLTPEPVFVPSTDNFDNEVSHLLEPVSSSDAYSSNEKSPAPCPEFQPLSSHCKRPVKEERSRRTKRIRTIFTPSQLERLELEFERTQYLVGSARLQLASELTLSESQVKVWFQNRRIKQRKHHQEIQQAKLAKLKDDSEVDNQSELSNNLELYSSCTSGDESSH